jgi:putative DNA-invertase from lambdoid prophage Rac
LLTETRPHWFFFIYGHVTQRTLLQRTEIDVSTVLYARVSTSEQTIHHQEAQARAAGFAIDQVVADNGVSGVATLLVERPEGRRLFDLLRARDTLVVRWVDRLGRNYTDVIDTIREFMRRGVVI